MLVSNSEVQLFRRCKRRWAFNYYHQYKVADDDEPIYFTEGTMWHDALEAYYMDDLEAAFASITRAEMYMDSEKSAKIKWQKWRNLLKSYNNWVEEEGVDQNIQMVQIEEAVLVDLDADHQLRCKIDAVIFDEDLNHYGLMDHKTSGTGFKVIDNLPINQQSRTYALACKLSPDVPDLHSAMYSITRKVDPEDNRSNPPYHMRAKIYIEDGLIESHHQEMLYTVREMQQFKDYLDAGGTAMPATVETDCSWCDYNAICPLVGDPQGDWEWAMKANFVQQNPNERYL